MKALIIAAGRGQRLGHLTDDKPKPLVQLLGRSLIERVVLTAREAGIRHFVIVVGYLGNEIKAKLGNGDRYGIEIEYVENIEWERANAVSVLKAKDLMTEDFILLMSDHIFDARILKALVNHDLRSSVVLAVDRRQPLPGDTLVLEKNGKIVQIGKQIEQANFVDTGLFLCSPKMFSYIEEAVNEGGEELADGIAKAVSNSDAAVFDITKLERYASKMRKDIEPWWIDIDTEDDLARAQKIIIENASKDPSDALATYVHKPIENKLVAWIVNYNITANQLTVLVNILGYTVTALFFFGHLLPASILAFVVGIADGLDGKLARVKLQASNLGSLEHSFDLLFEFSWFIALSWYLHRSTGSTGPLISCIFIILFIAFYRHVYDQFRRTMGKSLDDSGHFERIFRRIAGRRNLYNIPILVGVLASVPLYSLVFIVFHSGMTAVIYSLRAIKHLSAADRRGE